MSQTVRIAGVQMDVAFKNVDANLARMETRLDEAAGKGAKLIIFPECVVAGYCFESLADAMPFAEPIPGPSVARIAAMCQRLGVHVVAGMLERDGDRLFNAAVLVGPAGLVGNYRKAHLPYLGVDRFTTPGDRPFAVHQAGDLRIGLNICYDSSFPEAARILMLLGADLICLPTNWPPSAECNAEYVINARSMENVLYYAAVNRVGSEAGFNFIGMSRITDPKGRTLAFAPEPIETIVYADVDPELARTKRLVRVPDKHLIDRRLDRRPDLYGKLVEPIER